MEIQRQKKLKVFHGLVNYGTQAGFFALELRNQGIDALSVSSPDSFKRQIDVELLHGGNTIEKIFKHSWNWIQRFYWFFRYNTFHFYFGNSLFPRQWDLPLYRLFGKKVIMEYLGFDVQLYQYSIEKYDMTNVKFVFNDITGRIHDNKIIARMNFELKYIDLKFVCAPCYSEFVPDSVVLPLAIDLNEYTYSKKVQNQEEIMILHAPTNKDNKGTSFIIAAVNKLKSKGYKIKLEQVESVTHKELKSKYDECDIFIDQITGGWYGTASLEAMAIGRPTVCFLRESYFEYIDYAQKIPIINANPFTIYDVLKNLIEEKNKLPLIGVQSRKFVEEIHDLKKITNTLIEYYQGLK